MKDGRFRMKINDNTIRICDGLLFHYYGDTFQAHWGPQRFCDLNSLHELFLQGIAKGQSVESVYKDIARAYDFDENDSVAQNGYEQMILTLIKSGIIVADDNCSRKKASFYGEKGKKYPLWIACEVTGRCNFACPHCYKNADSGGIEMDEEVFYNI